MKKSLLFTLALFLLGWPSAGLSNNITEVSEESLAQINELHTKAEGQIVQNDFRGAIRTYEDILLIEPDDESAYTNLGRIYMILGNMPKAGECFQNALHIDPENEVAMLGLEKIRDPDGVTMPVPLPATNFSSTTSPLPVSVEIRTAATASVESKTEDSLSPPFEAQIQQALKNSGLYIGEVDGKIGPASRAATIRFQKIHGLTPDGKIGPKTWALLEPYLRTKNRDQNY